MSISLHPDIAKEPAGETAGSGAAAREPATKIRNRLFTKYVALFVAVVAVALLSNGIFEVFFYYREHKASLIRIQREQAEAAAAKISQFVKEIESQLGWTTQLPWSAGSIEQRRFDALRLLRQVPAITELALVDSTGKERLRVSRLAMDVVDSGLDLSKEPKFTEAVANKVYYGPVYFRRESEPYMTLALAGTRKDAGVSIAEVNLKLIWDVVSQIKVGERGQAYVVGSGGRLIAHPDISLVLRNTDMSKLIQVQAAQSGGAKAPDALQEALNIQGQQVLTASAPINPLGWTMFVELPVEEAYASLYQALQRLAIVLLAASIFAVLAGVFLARRMVGPIQALRAGAARIGGGDFTQRISIKSGDELEGLANQFNDMGERLQESYADLEQKVERRTSELSEALERQTATADILKVIASSPDDVQPVFQAIAERSNQLVHGLSTTVLSIVDDIVHLSAFTPTSPEADKALIAFFPRPLADLFFGDAIRRGEIYALPDAETEPTLRDLARLRGYRSMLFVPLLHEGVPIGMIGQTRVDPGPFAENHVQLLKTFADQAVIAISNVRLFQEVQKKTRDITEALEAQEASSDILRVISGSPTDVKPVFEAIVLTATRLFGCNTAAVLQVDGSNLSHVAAAWSDRLFAKDELPPTLPIDAYANFTSRAVLEKKTILIPDYAAIELSVHERTIRDEYGVRSGLFLPLLRERECVGVFLLTAVNTGVFGEKEIALAESFRDQAQIAIENTRLFRETRESLDQQTATADVLKVISRSVFNLDSILEILLERASRLCSANRGTVFLRQGGALVPAAVHGMPEGTREALIERPLRIDETSAGGRAILTKRVCNIEDVRADSLYGRQDLASVGHYLSIIGVPLMKDGEAIGAFSLPREEPGAFTPRQIELLTTFADQAVIAIENARLFEEVQTRTKELEESLEVQTATAEVLGVISRSPDNVQPVLEAIAHTARRICGAAAAHIYMLADGAYQQAASTRAADDPWHIYAARVPITVDTPGSATARAARELRTVHVVDTSADPEHDQGLFKEQTPRTVVSVPLVREGVAIGVITLNRDVIDAFLPRQIELLTTFADQAVIAIQNSRLFEEVQARTREVTESLEQQTATAEILNVIASSPSDMQPVFEAIARTAVRLIRCSTAYVILNDGRMLTPVAAALAEGGQAPMSSSFPLDPAANFPSRVVLEKKLLRIPDFSLIDLPPHERIVHEQFGARAGLILPMMREGECLGLLAMTDRSADHFTEKDIALAEIFCNQAVIGIENVRLFNETKESLAQQTATADVLKVISRSVFDLETVLKTLIDTAVRLCRGSRGTIFLRRGDHLVASAFHSNVPPGLRDYIIATPPHIDDDSLMSRAFRSGEVVHIPDLNAERDLVDEGFRARAAHGAIVCVPLMRNGVAVGVFGIPREEVRAFSAREIEMVKSFADQAVIAIENARLFDEVQSRTAELSQSLDELRTAQDRLVQTEKLASLGQLTAGIAHEIKNPLNFVNNFSALSSELIDELNDVLKPAPLEAKTREEIDELTLMLKGNLEKVVQHGKRADSIVKNMLLHSREGSGEHRPVEINAIVEESLNLAYHGARAEKPNFNITLQRDFASDAGLVDLYPQEITRVFLNLISNGFYAASKRKEAGEEGYEPTLKASTKHLGSKVEIRIRDNGTGIPPEVKEKMFNPFFTTKPAGEGTGLGLSMSHDIIVKQHSGTVDVATQPGQFTEFIITLPRNAAAHQQAGERT